MHTFAEKPKAPQKTPSAKSTILGGSNFFAQDAIKAPFFGQSHEVNSNLHSQHAIGNQATQRMLQTDSEEPQADLTSLASPSISFHFSRISVHASLAGAIHMKLAINKPGDVYEQEADAVADKVMRMPATQTDSFFQPKSLTVNPVQRKYAACEQEELLQREEEEESR